MFISIVNKNKKSLIKLRGSSIDSILKVKSPIITIEQKFLFQSTITKINKQYLV